MNEDQKTFLGLSLGCLIWIGLFAILLLGGAAFTIWWNYHVEVPLQNSQRYVQTCNVQYLVTQKARIENDLIAISNTNLEIADPNYASMKPQLQAQEKTNADDIYNALHASQCSRSQIIQDMPELQSFFNQFPTR